MKTRKRATADLPKAGQLWRTRAGERWGKPLLTHRFHNKKHVDPILRDNEVIMVISDGKWYIQNENEWLVDETIQKGFHVSIIADGRIYEDLRARTDTWDMWFEVVEPQG